MQNSALYLALNQIEYIRLLKDVRLYKIIKMRSITIPDSDRGVYESVSRAGTYIGHIFASDRCTVSKEPGRFTWIVRAEYKLNEMSTPEIAKATSNLYYCTEMQRFLNKKNLCSDPTSNSLILRFDVGLFSIYHNECGVSLLYKKNWIDECIRFKNISEDFFNIAKRNQRKAEIKAGYRMPARPRVQSVSSGDVAALPSSIAIVEDEESGEEE